MWDKVKNFYKAHVEAAGVLPIVFVMGILPLIVKQKDYMTNLDMFSWYSTEQIAVDTFNYYKRNFLIAAAVVMTLLLLVDLLDGSARIKKQAKSFFVILAAYELLVVLSCVFSDYRWFSVYGTFGHFETVFVLLSYGLLTLYSYCTIRKAQDVRSVLFLWGMLLIPMVLLGLSQATGHDFFSTPAGNRLILTDAAYKSGASIEGMLGAGRVYLSLYNPNYVGSYGALVTPLLLILCIYAKNWRQRLMYGLITAGLLVCLLAALAKTGLIALVVSLMFLGILLRKQIVRRKKIFMVGVLVVCVTCTWYMYVRGDRLITAVKGAVSELTKNTVVYNLEGIETRQDGVEVSYKGNQFLVQCAVNNASGNVMFSVTDGQGMPVSLKLDADKTSYKIDDHRFQDITITPVTLKGDLAFDLNIEGKSRYFSNQTTYEGYYYYSPYGKYTTIHTAPHLGFEGYEKFATNRGYIWSRTLPLLSRYMFLGSGPDTFLMAFPQNDYVVKDRYGFQNSLMSKPHNMYLQIGVQTGVLSLVAFVALYMVYAVWSLKIYWKNTMEGWLPAVGTSIFASTVAYMLVGLTADSSINVAPVFWCILGIGMAVNQMVVESPS